MQENRSWIILSLFFLTGSIFLVKLFFIQVLSEEYKLAASDNSVKKTTIYPHRGIIYDRNGKELVVNTPVYDLMVVPREVKLKDTLAFCKLIGISLEEFKKNMKKAIIHPNSRNKPSAFLKQISKYDYAGIQDKLIDYQGFFVSSRTIRSYPHKSLANALGYISEISPTALEKDKTGYYNQGDYVGTSGVEAYYEKELRGKKGVRQIWVDAKGREKGKFKNGAFDTLSVAGENLISSIDLDLQQYGELLMQNKAGAIVAIEPSTGEILSLISAPSYDPNLLSGREFAKNYKPLAQDENKPLFNRAIQSLYPPGSTFKTVQALIGLQEGVINAQSVFPCDKSLVKCHWHPVTDLQRSLQHSCNPYYFRVYRRIIYQNKLTFKDSMFVSSPDGDGRIGFEKWRKYTSAFNLGRKTGVDLANENNGNIPLISLYDKRYGVGEWKFSNIYSLGIGQGEVGVLPVQLANVAATIANRGYYYTPHIIKGIGKDKKKHSTFTQKNTIPIDKEHFDLVIDGMRDAYRMGTVQHYAIIPDIEICGKTGTAQNPHGQDHAVFIAFAPKDNPKIAMAVYVENAGFGGDWAAPIAALMIEKYLKGKITKDWTEKYILDKQFLFKKLPLEELPKKDDPKESKENKPNQDKIAETQKKIITVGLQRN